MYVLLAVTGLIAASMLFCNSRISLTQTAAAPTFTRRTQTAAAAAAAAARCHPAV